MAKKKTNRGPERAETSETTTPSPDDERNHASATPAHDNRRLEPAMRQLAAEAMGRQGKVLYPKPDDMDSDRYRAAIDALVEKGHANGGVYPNLTHAGIEAWQRSG